MNKIFVYSATGNSFASARQFKDFFESNDMGQSELVHITDELMLSNALFEGEIGVLVFPVYAYGVPKLVKKFIKNNFFKFEYFASVTTQGSQSGGSLAETIRLFKGRNQKVNFSGKIKSVENFVHMFKLATSEKIKIIVKDQTAKTNKIAADIKAKKANKRFMLRPDSAFVSIVFRSVTGFFAKKYKVLDTCDGCGICYKVCPTKAIKMRQVIDLNVGQGADGPGSDCAGPNNCDAIRPSFIAKKCDNCQACLQLCPQKAIKFGKITPDSRRYIHPQVKLSDLIKRNSDGF